MQVRVAVNFRPADLNATAICGAGLILTDGKNLLLMERVAQAATPLYVGFQLPERWLCRLEEAGPPLEKPAYLRAKRRGDTIRFAHSNDGKEWFATLADSGLLKFPRRLKVGVFAEAAAKGTFKATFDRFKFTPLKK
jgi:hypothetical protein